MLIEISKSMREINKIKLYEKILRQMLGLNKIFNSLQKKKLSKQLSYIIYPMMNKLIINKIIY